MLLTLAITLLVTSAVLTVVATPFAPGTLTASCIAWTAQCWNDDRALAVQYAFLAALSLAACAYEVRHRRVEIRRRT